MIRRMACCTALLMCAVFDISAQQAAVPTEPRFAELMSAGQTAFDTGAYADALKKFREAFESNPGDVGVNFYLGRAAFETRDFETAVMAFERVLMADPSLERAKLELARSYQELGVIELAKAYYNEVLAGNPPAAVRRTIEELMGTVEPSSKITGERLFKVGRYDRALANFRAALRAKPDLPGLNALCGQAALLSGDAQAAVEAFERELGANPDSLEIKYFLARSYNLLGDRARAQALFDEILRSAPSGALAREVQEYRKQMDWRFATPLWRAKPYSFLSLTLGVTWDSNVEATPRTWDPGWQDSDEKSDFSFPMNFLWTTRQRLHPERRLEARYDISSYNAFHAHEHAQDIQYLSLAAGPVAQWYNSELPDWLAWTGDGLRLDLLARWEHMEKEYDRYMQAFGGELLLQDNLPPRNYVPFFSDGLDPNDECILALQARVSRRSYEQFPKRDALHGRGIAGVVFAFGKDLMLSGLIAEDRSKQPNTGLLGIIEPYLQVVTTRQYRLALLGGLEREDAWGTSGGVEEDVYSYSGRFVAVDAVRQGTDFCRLGHHWLAFAQASMNWRDYDEKDQILEALGYTSWREDKTAEVTVGLKVALDRPELRGKWLRLGQRERTFACRSLSLTYSYTDSRSPIFMYEYRRHIVAAAVELTF